MRVLGVEELIPLLRPVDVLLEPLEYLPLPLPVEVVPSFVRKEEELPRPVETLLEPLEYLPLPLPLLSDLKEEELLEEYLPLPLPLLLSDRKEEELLPDEYLPDERDEEVIFPAFLPEPYEVPPLKSLW